MSNPAHESPEKTWPLGAVTRLTGLSPELLRAWERRHRAVQPLRTAGGVRRYRATDLERLRLLKAAIDAGHRIGQLAALSDAELERLADAPTPAAGDPLAAMLDAIDALDGAETRRLLALQLSVLGAVRFVHEIAQPLALEIGRRWEAQRLGIAAEHLATAALRTLLGSALFPGAHALRGPRVLFATLPGERHELGLLMAALSALAAGANPIYLGTEVPAAELASAARRSGAAVLALSVVMTPPAEVTLALAALRRELPAEVLLWIGGSAADALSTPSGVERLSNLEQLEQRVGLLALDARRQA